MTFTRQVVLATVALSSFLFAEEKAGPPVSANERGSRILVGNISPPTQWRIIEMEPEVTPTGHADQQRFGLSAASEEFSSGPRIEQFLEDNDLTMSPDGVRMVSERGELIGRVLTSLPDEDEERSNERLVRYLIYGAVDGRDYAAYYEFAYNREQDGITRALIRDLDGAGQEIDYTTGEVFELRGKKSETMKAINWSCLYENFKAGSCPAAVTGLICLGTSGISCLTKLLEATAIHLACGLAFQCTPVEPFTLRADNSSRRVQQGSSTTYTITARFASGFTGPVSGLSVSGLPAGVSHSFSRNVINASGESTTLTIITQPSTPTGRYPFRVSASGGGKTYSITLELYVDQGQGVIDVRATLNGVAWTGSLMYSLNPSLGLPTIGTTVPNTHTGMWAGSYSITRLSGGPAGATLNSVTPSGPQTLSAGGRITFTFNFSSSGGGTPLVTTLPGSVARNQWWVQNFTVPANRSNLTVTLGWSGSDDLDLQIVSPAGTVYGWRGISQGYSGSLKNPESILVSNPQPGSWQVRVFGYSVPSGTRSFIVTVSVQ